MHTSTILFILITEPLPAEFFFFSPGKTSHKTDVLPWVGVLKIQQGNTEALTRLILIGNRKAIGNANDISRLDKVTLRKLSTAIFFENSTTWHCNVTDYSLHPEFHRKMYNTVAVVHLNCKMKEWFPIHLPIHNISATSAYAIGLTDNKNKELQQSIFRMVSVNESICKDFYKNEGLDFRNYWPKHLLCYKAADIKRRCVFDSGMALAVQKDGNWLLVGLGILGPGCGLPSRYIELAPYIPWLNFHIRGKQKSLRRQYMLRQSRRTSIDPSKDIVSDSHGNVDEFYVDKLDDTTMALRPAYANVREEAYGDCLLKAQAMMYRDAGIVQAPRIWGTGVYALSLYDLRRYRITCVMVTVRCKSRSITKFWYEKGFRADDFAEFIKVVPHPKKERGGIPPKILFLTDHYHQYDNITTANIVFKFEFQNEATINVDFYGDVLTTTPPPTTTTLNTRTRTRRTYPRHMHSTVQNG